MRAPEDRPDEATLRKALQRIHHVATGQSDRAYMSIPADPKRDADLLLSAAIDELVELRRRASEGRPCLGQAIEKIAEVRDWLHRAQGYSLPAGGGADRVRKLIDRCDEAVNLIDEAMPPEGPR